MLLCLAACTPAAITPNPNVDPLPKGTDDSCNAARYHTLIGRAGTDLEKILIMGKVRIIRFGSVVTMDYLPDRMNIHIDQSGTINRISCG